MTFDHLPPNWSELPMTTPGLAADVIDLVVSIRDRFNETLAILPCQSDGVPLPTPMLISPQSWQGDQQVRDQRAGLLATVLAGLVSDPDIDLAGVVIGLGSTTLDREVAQEWRASLTTAVESVGLRVWGCYLAGRYAVTSVDEEQSSAA